jgi:hypothetical protein
MTTTSYRTCRFCQKGGTDVFKYGVRHYSHFACYLDAGRPLADLSRFKIEQFPFRLLKDRGLVAEAERLIGGGA